MAATPTISNPAWTVAIPVAGLMAIAALAFGVSPLASIGVAVRMACVMAACVFAAVHHAEVIAAKVGEPFGSIILALAVTVLEVGLIFSLMLGAPDGGPTIARDTVFSAIMIMTTGIIGFSLLFGSRRHFEQTIRLRGTSSALSVLVVLAVITLILPNFTVASQGPT